MNVLSHFINTNCKHLFWVYILTFSINKKKSCSTGFCFIYKAVNSKWNSCDLFIFHYLVISYILDLNLIFIKNASDSHTIFHLVYKNSYVLPRVCRIEHDFERFQNISIIHKIIYIYHTNYSLKHLQSSSNFFYV